MSLKSAPPQRFCQQPPFTQSTSPSFSYACPTQVQREAIVHIVPKSPDLVQTMSVVFSGQWLDTNLPESICKAKLDHDVFPYKEDKKTHAQTSIAKTGQARNLSWLRYATTGKFTFLGTEVSALPKRHFVNLVQCSSCLLPQPPGEEPMSGRELSVP